jgi:hypothetical protein
MPNETLIAALEGLRNTCAQRQRLTNNLMTALKSTSSALGKVNRAVREYTEQNSGLSAGIARAQASFGELRLKEEAIDPVQPELRREIKQLATLTAALKDALTALDGESVDVIRLEHAYRMLQNSKVQDAALANLLPQIEQELEQAQRALGDSFGLALRHALEQHGITLGGRPPRFEIGRFELAANFVNRSAVLSYGKNPLSKRVPLSVEGVIAAYQRENKAIAGRSEDGSRWIEQLYTAWEAVRRKRGIGEPRASIVECFYEMVLLRQSRAFRSAPSKNSFADYSRAQFAYDFFEFTNNQSLHHNGLRPFGLVATKSQAESAERSIWIVEGDSPHAGRYIADVKFDRDE